MGSKILCWNKKYPNSYDNIDNANYVWKPFRLYTLYNFKWQILKFQHCNINNNTMQAIASNANPWFIFIQILENYNFSNSCHFAFRGGIRNSGVNKESLISKIALGFASKEAIFGGIDDLGIGLLKLWLKKSAWWCA